MFDEERFLELSNQSRIAWSARPVWDRKPPLGGRGNRQTYLDFTSRHHANHSGNHVGYNSHHSLAQSKSNVELLKKRRGSI